MLPDVLQAVAEETGVVEQPVMTEVVPATASAVSWAGIHPGGDAVRGLTVPP